MSKLGGVVLGLVVALVLLNVLVAFVSAHAALLLAVGLLVVATLALLRFPRRRYFGRPY